jgi:membrane associated rhomboid family serine protease
VRQGDLVGAARAYREAERRAPASEQPMIASRLGWLNKEMGNAGTAGRYFRRARGGFVPYASYAIIAITVVVSLFISYGGQAGQELGNLLELNKQAVMAGEYWRLVTVTLVHAGFLHLGLNMYALYIIGPLVEALYGRFLFVLFYLLAAIGGSIASYLTNPVPSVGASGAVFGLFGLIFLTTFVHRPVLGRQTRTITSQIGMLIAINLVFGFVVGGIDNSAHIGGLLAGAWLGAAVAPRGATTLLRLWQNTPPENAPFRERYAAVIAIAGIGALVVVLLFLLSVTPFWVPTLR